MATPTLETSNTTHTYVAHAWYQDTATWFNLASIAAVVLQETTFQQAIPERYHPAIVAAVAVLNIVIRFQLTNRPVALQEGTPVQVPTIDPKPPDVGAVDVNKLGKGVIVLALAGGLFNACATAGPTHIATVSVVSAHAVLSAVQDTEMLLVCGKPSAPTPPACVPDATHRQISADLETAFGYDAEVAKVARAALQAGTALPANIAELVGKIRGIVDGILGRLPTSPQKTALVSQLGGAK